MFEKVILDTSIYYLLCQYLSVLDNKYLSMTNQKIYQSSICRKIRNSIIYDRSSSIISNIFRRYIQMIRIFNYPFQELTDFDYIYVRRLRRLNALSYYRYYDKKYIYSWYNMKIKWKRNIIRKYY